MQLYSPNKAAFDAAIPFLWLMAVSTTACAAVWTAVVVGEEVIRKEKKDRFSRFHGGSIIIRMKRLDRVCIGKEGSFGGRRRRPGGCRRGA